MNKNTQNAAKKTAIIKDGITMTVTEKRLKEFLNRGWKIKTEAVGKGVTNAAANADTSQDAPNANADTPQGAPNANADTPKDETAFDTPTPEQDDGAPMTEPIDDAPAKTTKAKK